MDPKPTGRGPALGRRAALTLGAAAVLGGCASLPRGAPLLREVVAADEGSDFQVVPVTRGTLDAIQGWPAPVGSTGRSWLPGGGGSRDRVINPGDMLTLTVFDPDPNSLLLTEGQRSMVLDGVEVSPAGTIFVPFLDRISVAGRSPESARQLIQRRLTSIAPSGQVQLVQTVGRAGSVDVIGGVGRPGRYPLGDRATGILSVIAEAGGPSPAFENPQVTLLRGGSRYVTTLDHLYGDPGADTVLRGGDQVTITEDPRSFVAIGATGREELIEFPQERITALEGLALASGLNDQRGDPGGVLVLREYAASDLSGRGHGPARRRVVFTIDLTTADGLFSANRFLLADGDAVVATEAPVTAAAAILDVFGSALAVGARL